MSKKAQKGAGRSQSGSGNVTIDLGESIERKLRSAGLSGGASRHPHRPGSYRPGGYRPGMFGGYRPWYASRYSSLGDRFNRWTLGAKLGLPSETKTSELLTGSLLGIAGNRALVRVTPELIASRSKLLHEGIAFGAGLIPLLVKRNSMTVGVAIPGLVFFGGSLVDWLLDMVGMPKPALQGTAPGRSGADAAWSARQKLANIQSRMNQPAQAQSAYRQRVVAQPRYA